MSLTFTPLTGPISEKIDRYFGYKNSIVEINPGRVMLPPKYEEIAERVLNAPVKKDDVWLLSVPRTGSTWTQEMVWLIGNHFDYDRAKSTIQHLRTPLVELSAVFVDDDHPFMKKYGNSVDFINNLPSPRYIKSHLPIHLLPKELDVVKPKIIYVARHPKDMCVSYYMYCKLVHHFDAPFEEFCELFLQDLVPVAPIWDHILSFWNKRHEPNVLFVRYEDMKRDLDGMIRKTAQFLEKPITDEQIEKLKEHLSFEKMKNNPAVNLKPIMDITNGENYYERTGISFIRKGEVGDWRNYMSPELSDRFDKWTEINLKGTDLSFD